MVEALVPQERRNVPLNEIFSGGHISCEVLLGQVSKTGLLPLLFYVTFDLILEIIILLELNIFLSDLNI